MVFILFFFFEWVIVIDLKGIYLFISLGFELNVGFRDVFVFIFLIFSKIIKKNSFLI